MVRRRCRHNQRSRSWNLHGNVYDKLWNIWKLKYDNNRNESITSSTSDFYQQSSYLWRRESNVDYNRLCRRNDYLVIRFGNWNNERSRSRYLYSNLC